MIHFIAKFLVETDSTPREAETPSNNSWWGTLWSSNFHFQKQKKNKNWQFSTLVHFHQTFFAFIFFSLVSLLLHHLTHLSLSFYISFFFFLLISYFLPHFGRMVGVSSLKEKEPEKLTNELNLTKRKRKNIMQIKVKKQHMIRWFFWSKKDTRRKKKQG